MHFGICIAHSAQEVSTSEARLGLTGSPQFVHSTIERLLSIFINPKVCTENYKQQVCAMNATMQYRA